MILIIPLVLLWFAFAGIKLGTVIEECERSNKEETDNENSN